jgi:hypothetical protein
VKRLRSIVIGGVIVASAGIGSGAALAQTNAEAARAEAARAEAAQRLSRYQIGQLERLFEGAVEHGLSMVRERLQTIAQMPADLLVSDNAHARGFRLEGYGVFFDVSVPSFDASMTWSLRTLDQNDLGFDSALKAIQDFVKSSGDVNLEQALRRVELQVNPGILTRSTAPPTPGARTVTASAASVSADRPATDPILVDPNEAYRVEVVQALKDAMLDHAASLGIGPADWLTIAAKRNDDRPRLAPADTDARTRIIRLRGSDLAAYLAQQITREEALRRIEVKIF